MDVGFAEALVVLLIALHVISEYYHRKEREDKRLMDKCDNAAQAAYARAISNNTNITSGDHQGLLDTTKLTPPPVAEVRVNPTNITSVPTYRASPDGSVGFDD